jgi:hypothetical protein
MEEGPATASSCCSCSLDGDEGFERLADPLDRWPVAVSAWDEGKWSRELLAEPCSMHAFASEMREGPRRCSPRRPSSIAHHVATGPHLERPKKRDGS